MEEKQSNPAVQQPDALVSEAMPDLSTGPAAPPRKKKKLWFARHKVLTALLVLLLVGGFAAWRFYTKAQQASANAGYSFVRTTTLKKTSLNNSVTTTGTVAAGSTASVTVSDNAKLYKVTEVKVKVGDAVQEGDVIASLDTSEVEKNIEKAKQDYNDTLQAAQTSYDRAVDDYNTAVTEHENKLVELKEKIDEANKVHTDAKDKQTSAQSSYDAASASYNTIKAAYDTATAQVASFQNAYDAALTSQDSALAALNAAISNYQNSVAAYQAGTLDGANLVNGAQDMINAYHLYNGNDSAKGSNVCDVAALRGQLEGYGVDSATAAVLSDVGTAYSESAVGICESAQKNLADAQGSVSNAGLGYTSMAEIEKALSEATATLSTASANLDNAKSAVETAEKSVKTAQDNYDTENNSTTLKSRKQSVEDANTKLTQAKRTPDNLTTYQQTLENCTLTATMSGTITALNATVGSVCSGTVATIQDTKGLTVDITISADKVPDVSTGMPCYITTDTTDETINGTLSQIDPVANEQGSFGAEVTVTGDTTNLLIGTSAQVEIMESQTENVFVVPIDAVGTADDGSSFVYRQNGGEGVDMTFEQVTVTTGAANDYYTEISGSDLAEGDVIRSSSDLTQGIENSDNTQDAMEMMQGGMTVTHSDSADIGGGAPPSGGGGAPGGM